MHILGAAFAEDTLSNNPGYIFYTGAIEKGGMGHPSTNNAYALGANAGDLVLYAMGTTNNKLLLAAGDGPVTPTAAVALDNTGKLGVGTFTPSERLEVSGNIRINGSYMRNSDIGTTFTCSSGQAISTATVKGGIITAGSCASVGAGDVITTADNLFTGKNKVGPQAYTVSITSASSGNFNNHWMVVASTNPTFAPSVGFSNFKPGQRYRISWIFTQRTSSGRLEAQFNGDGGSNYFWGMFGVNDQGSNQPNNGTSDTSCHLTPALDTGINRDSFGKIEFITSPIDGTTVLSRVESTYVDGNPFTQSQDGGCRYDGASNLSTITFSPTAGSMDGFFQVEQLILP